MASFRRRSLGPVEDDVPSPPHTPCSASVSSVFFVAGSFVAPLWLARAAPVSWIARMRRCELAHRLWAQQRYRY
ncbi:hypothetical protein BU26DRAFT_517721 [Trematosphaeria pertusa]|uniref:Uncharacterized protein n=1 Tax=Trematosphaeria pertusa TaxID=390896 RepID=A0A6A6IK39_9PLEO|nr:uncharacterized protein BU26DRAFT_517721 [Trematosphaeria pertusa]KAF2250965.1 hypothetical protein BU26DRAFT_517721 [Trematosphaeria pertusa]